MVEDISKRREPLPQLVGVYFISPTNDNVRQLVRDFSLATMPQYKVGRAGGAGGRGPHRGAAGEGRSWGREGSRLVG